MDKKLLLLILLGTLFFMSGCSKNKDHGTEHSHSSEKKAAKSYYTCSMHPQVKEDAPGKCPICHMNLTKVELDDSEDQLSMAEQKPVDQWQCKDYPDVTSAEKGECPIDGTPMIKIDTSAMTGAVVAKVKLRKAQMNHFSPSFFPVTKMKMTKKIRLLGTVLQSEEKESSIPARVPGRIEKVYVKSTGSLVRVGDPVVDLYSPKLITAGEEYILAKKSYKNSKSREFADLIKQSEKRLELWGIKKSQYEQWYKKGKVPNQITIYSNGTGIVRTRAASVGKYFKEGQNFFELSDLADVWVEIDVYEGDSALVKLGQRVDLEFSALPGELLSGSIDFVSPVLDRKSRTLKVRATIQNTHGKLKPGMIAGAVLFIDFDGMPLVVPRSAIINTGKRKVVWVKQSSKKFVAKTILAGHESDGYVEVKNGLSDGDEVVIEGNFLLDAQAQLFGGYEDFSSGQAHQH
jgi:multidrug efflux pump subunit AcrA (membrane-fusion protein)